MPSCFWCKSLNWTAVGVSSGGPFLGRLVDAKGPRITLIIALLLLFGGYFGIKAIFDMGSGEPISSITLGALIFCQFITGVGGVGGSISSVNTVAKSFPDRLRTTTTGIVISAYGLSAFLFSAISRVVSPGNTSDFLLVLAIGTSFPMILGWLFIRPIPLPETERSNILESGIGENFVSGTDESLAIFARQNTSHTHLLADDVEISSGESGKLLVDGSSNLSGRAMLVKFDFWLLFTIMSLLGGTAIMWINNVGSIVQSLLAEGNTVYDDAESSKWQSIQVSTISMMNFSGRICIGIIADYSKNHLGLRRAYCISLVAFLFLSSQIAASFVSDVKHLHIASAMLGCAYGGLCSLLPTITIEWFGLAHFSENWGTVCLASLLGGNLFSFAFGINLDAHTPSVSPASGNAQCVQGVECYISSIRLTIGTTFLALVLAILAGVRDRRRFVDVKASGPEAVFWEAEED